MALKKFVKVSKIDNLSDARYCAGMMVDMLGFNLVPNSDRYVNPELFHDMTEWISGVALVGECGNMSPEDIKLSLTSYNLDYIETNNIKILEELTELGLPLILKVNNSLKSHDLSYASDLVDFIIFEINDTGTQPDDLINGKLIKAFDISMDNISELDPKWHGVELIAPEEERPGYADYGNMMDILEILDEDQ